MTNTELRTKVRLFIRDKASLNKLLDNTEEIDDDTIDQAAEIAIMYLNNVPPAFITFGSSVDDFTNSNSQSMLVLATSAYSIMSAGVWQSRNSLTFNDGGLNLRIEDKTNQYMAIAQNFLNLAGQMASNYKISQNRASFQDTITESTLGSVSEDNI